MNCAVTIETRILEKFPDTVRQHMKYLKGWDLVIFGSDKNEDFFSRNLSNFIFHKINQEPFGIHQVNQLMTQPNFWELLYDYERVLIFQHDSGLLRDGIEEFLKYDYVGAPWKFQQHGGNGGLSIRNPKMMHLACRSKQWNHALGNEDVFFCNHFNYGSTVAPRSVCEMFSVETIFKLGTLGYHAIDAHLTKEQCEQIKNQYKRIAV